MGRKGGRERKTAGERREGKEPVKEWWERNWRRKKRWGGTGGIVEEEGKEVEDKRVLRVRVEGAGLSRREERGDSREVDIRSSF